MKIYARKIDTGNRQIFKMIFWVKFQMIFYILCRQYYGHTLPLLLHQECIMAKKGKLKALSSNIHFKILWGVYDRFFVRKREDSAMDHLVTHGEFGSFVDQVVTDICDYITKCYTEDTKFRSLVDQRHELKDVKGIILNTQKNGIKPGGGTKLVEATSFRKFEKDLLPNFYHHFDINLDNSIPDSHLQVLCLYGFHKPYSEVSENKDMYIQDGYIRLIPTKVRDEFSATLRGVIESFEEANKKSRSRALTNLAIGIFQRKTQRDCENLAKGEIHLDKQEYLGELARLMEICEMGFGISIPDFNTIWSMPPGQINQALGQPILESNKRQSEGLSNEHMPDRRPFRYIRIFFVEEGSGGVLELSNADTEIIRNQLRYNVRVYIIFKSAWYSLSSEELQAMDFAVLKIDGWPALMTTKFAGEETEGVFFSDEKNAEEYYMANLDKILIPGNRHYIFEPMLGDDENEVSLGPCLTETGLAGVKAYLREIYTKSSPFFR
ncbi:hypothetical protein [Dyadobacter pollutisoli]|uniref:Uncharacterized protein n=1 Tax=Dyadobacter pollutisoli TaxID=2910158 RepID=A0A9E8NCC3_9BACT|nr:hypothetical protein [Dyadobacter pollutisoli]WAC12397.1 hypothetical protein ON006_00250 [Dyadobacter pollutisoli]